MKINKAIIGEGRNLFVEGEAVNFTPLVPLALDDILEIVSDGRAAWVNESGAIFFSEGSDGATQLIDAQKTYVFRCEGGVDLFGANIRNYFPIDSGVMLIGKVIGS